MKESKTESNNHWQKTPVSNLVRYVASGILFARIRVQGKLIRRSLKTKVLSVAKLRLAASLGVDRVKGHHVWAHFTELQPLNLRRNADSIRRWNETVLAARAAAAESRLPNGEPVILENFHLLEDSCTKTSPQLSRCQFLGREAWVSAEGRFNPCCAPDAQRRTLGEFGNLNERSLGEIWDSPEYRHLTQTYHSRPLCQQCTMRQPV